MSVEARAALFSSDDVASRVSALASQFRNRLQQTEAERSVPRASIDELIGAGVARLLVPREQGGTDGRLRSLLELTAAAAAGCPSTGWIASLMAHNAHVVGLFPEAGQRAVWAWSPDVVIAGSVAPAGRAVPVPGGYRLTGRHGFTSGVNNAEWVFVGAMVEVENEAPEWRLFLLEKSNFVVVDVWQTAGMRGTGSNTVVEEDVFVPADHTLSQQDAREGTGAGATVNADGKYRLPWIAYATLGFTATILGAAQGTYDHVCAALAQKRSPAGVQVADGQLIQVEIGFVAAKIATARKILLDVADRADAESAYTIQDRAVVLRDNAFAAQLLSEAVDTLVQLNGTSGYLQSSPVQQFWRDVHFAGSHQSLNRIENGGRYGRIALGVAESSTVGFY